jgi:hypothetical protein
MTRPSHTEPAIDPTGARVATALRAREERLQPMSELRLENVLSGARRRRLIARPITAAVCTAIVLLAAVGIARITRTQGSAEQVGSPSGQSLLPAYAMLSSANGLVAPQSMSEEVASASSSSIARGTEVWTRGDVTIGVQSIDKSWIAKPPLKSWDIGSGTGVPSWDGPAWPHLKTPRSIVIRGQEGLLAQLAPQQFVVRIPARPAERFSDIVVRGLSQSDALQAIEQLVNHDGVLRPSDEFTMVSQVLPTPPAMQTGASASVAYGKVHVSTSTQDPALEQYFLQFTTSDAVRSELIGGREVFVYDVPVPEGEERQSWASWVDPSGVGVGVSYQSDTTRLEDLVSSVRIVSPEVWQSEERKASERIAQTMPELDRVAVGGFEVVRRGAGSEGSLCVDTPSIVERCASARSRGAYEGSLLAHTQIDGQWVVFGFHPMLPGDKGIFRTPTFLASSGEVGKVDVMQIKGGHWYVARIPSGVESVETNLAELFGATGIRLNRPSGTTHGW